MAYEIVVEDVAARPIATSGSFVLRRQRRRRSSVGPALIVAEVILAVS